MPTVIYILNNQTKEKDTGIDGLGDRGLGKSVIRV